MSAKPRRTIVPAGPEETPAGAEQPKRRRLHGEERRAEILAEAAALFAEEGFGASTRALAARLGITQAALYKHFKTKDEIVAALFDKRASRWRDQDWSKELAAGDTSLAERLGRLYARYVGNINGRSMRLFMRAGLDGYGQPGRRGAMLTASILEPVIAELRKEAGLSDLARYPMQYKEREIAMTLHGALVFLAIRKHIYRMPLPDDLSELVMRQVRLWLPGAIEEIKRVHAESSEHTLPQLTPRR